MTEPDSALGITEESVVTARSDVASVEVEGELVLYDDVAGVLHRLNGAAAAVWMCIDGSVTLQEIAVDLADVFDAEPARVVADVVESARQFHRSGLLVGDGAAGPPARTDQPTSTDAAASAEADAALRSEADGSASFVAELPTPCMDPSFTLGSAGMLAVRVGNHVLGLRLSTLELVAAARAVLGDAVVPGVEPPPNVSVVETNAGVGTPLYFCYRSGWLVTRATSPRRALLAAATLLSSFDDAQSCQIPARVAVRAGEAALLCPESQVVAAGLGARLRAAGWDLADTASAQLDPETGEVVLAPPTVAVDPAALAAVPSRMSDCAPPAPGRYPVRVWVAVELKDAIVPTTAAARVSAVAVGSDSFRRAGASAVLEATRRMLRRAIWAVSPSLDAGAIVRTLASAVDPA